jgi:flavin-binding protein dodecin
MDVHEDVSGNNGSGGTSYTGFSSTDHEIGVSNHIVKVIEVLAESPRSWEDAAQVALREAARTLRNITSIYLKDMQAIVRDGRVAAWRINAKVSFVVNDQSLLQMQSLSDDRTTTTGGQNMSYRNRDQGRESSQRPWHEGNAFPEYEEYGLHGDNRREYRGRESYEQQSRGGQAGRSGMFSQRNVPAEMHERYRNNADEDRRGFQNIGARVEFESADRSRPDYGRYGKANDRDYEDARYGFDARDYGRREQGTYGSGNHDFGNRDFGNRDFGAREYGGYDRFDANRSLNDDYSRTDYGDPYRGRDYNRDYGAPFAQRSSYNSGYDRGPEYRSPSQSNYSTRSGPERGYIDQGRIAENEYGRSNYQRRFGQGPRGYKRSDERIREDVCDRLGQDWDVDATEVEVSVSSGEVTLSGTIGDRDQKFRVEHLADSVSGVTEVHNQLRVKRELPVQGQIQGSTPNTSQTARSTTNQNRSS